MYHHRPDVAMDRRNLKLRNSTWYARLKVPRSLRTIVGKSEIVRSLHTRDLREANRLKHAQLADMHDELARLESKATLPTASAKAVLTTASALGNAVSAGRATQAEADLALQLTLRDHVARIEPQASELGVSPADIVERTLKIVRNTFRNRRTYVFSRTIRDYLEERAPHITNQTLEQKLKQLGELADWVGPNSEVTEVTREQAGRYVEEVLVPSGRSVKTIKDRLSHLRAFWAWLVGRGKVEVNVWDGISGTLLASTRGREKRRSWSDSEVYRLLAGISVHDPLWPLSAIGAYTGMRREEIAQLTIADVTEDGALVVREGKTQAAVRRIPIHPVIQPLIERLIATTTDNYLIPGLLTGGRDKRRGHYLGKRFTNMRRQLGLDSPQTVFHCFRKALAQRCEDKEVPESTTELIGGWSRGHRMSYGLYSSGPSFETLRRAIAKVTYGEVDELVRRLAPSVEITMASHRRPVRSHLRPRREFRS